MALGVAVGFWFFAILPAFPAGVGFVVLDGGGGGVTAGVPTGLGRFDADKLVSRSAAVSRWARFRDRDYAGRHGFTLTQLRESIFGGAQFFAFK